MMQSVFFNTLPDEMCNIFREKYSILPDEMCNIPRKVIARMNVL